VISTASDDEELDASGFDPRWEVQPEPDQDDGTNGSRRWWMLALLALAGSVAAILWTLSDGPASL